MQLLKIIEPSVVGDFILSLPHFLSPSLSVLIQSTTIDLLLARLYVC